MISWHGYMIWGKVGNKCFSSIQSKVIKVSQMVLFIWSIDDLLMELWILNIFCYFHLIKIILSQIQLLTKVLFMNCLTVIWLFYLPWFLHPTCKFLIMNKLHSWFCTWVEIYAYVTRSIQWSKRCLIPVPHPHQNCMVLSKNRWR